MNLGGVPDENGKSILVDMFVSNEARYIKR